MELDKGLDELIRENSMSMGSSGGSSSTRRPKVSENYTNRLYVTHLDYKTSWQDLKDHFRSAGEVIYTSIFKDGNLSKVK